MNIDEVIETIESVEFEANLGLISDFERFARLALRQPEASTLLRTMSASRHARVVVETRVEQLVNESSTLVEHIHPHDIALAVYVLALHEVGSARLRSLAQELALNRMGWWSRHIAQRVLSSLAEVESQGLKFQFEWSEVDDDLATGRLLLWVAGELVWHDTSTPTSGVSATWSSVLENLSAVWPRLIWEDGFPAPIDARDPSEFDVKTRDYLDTIPARLAISKSELFKEFRKNHDISNIVPVEVASLWLLRQGHEMWACANSPDICIRRPAREIIASLRSLGDEIAARLADREPRLQQAWERAEQVDRERKISIYTGLDPGEVFEIGAAPAFELDDDTLDETELMAAARMLVQADFRTILSEVLKVIIEVPVASDTRQLDSISAAVERELDKLPPASKPHEQGYVVANWLRDYFGVGNSAFSPLIVLQQWNVDVIRCDLSEPDVEAIAVWGPRHGPAIILNQRAKFSSVTRETITLAHEIAHLVLDRRGALPLAEVLGGNLPKLVEQRARALAAELLLPRRIAGEEFSRTQNPSATLTALSSRFGVSHEVVAWQARNSEQVLPRHVESFLRMKVSKPESYGY